MLEEEDKYPSRQEREVYAKAILTGLGDRPDWDIAPPDEAFIRHVQLAKPSFVDRLFRDDGGRREATVFGGPGAGGGGPGVGGGHISGVTGSGQGHTTFNYEKWVRTGTARKVTGDYSFVAA